ncbi:conserved hypothetical protein [Altererythrobacter sp. B11]|uniref:DUF4142 domain-containing protein n=1 Tax=Altererythrobacter sp. B11 TaxID=2060312 RepID=UPI000DC73A8A|nr:DUF4142 domain-containing protein [Altererythrobacter sp. B11]BBC74346.1 conserved hypothetical protein [Altererythrobacter sp. B11]
MKTRFLFAGVGALALAACGSNNDADDTAMTDQPTDAMATSTDAMAPAAATAPMPQQFVDTAAASDTYEVEAAKLAQEHGSSQKVKDFAAQMVKDHTTSTENLRKAAAEVQGVTVNPQMTPMQQQNLEELRGAGDDFDATYARQQVAAHQAALDALNGYAQGGDAQPLKDFAGKTAKVVEHHLEMARELT